MKWERIWKWGSVPMILIIGWVIHQIVLPWSSDIALALAVLLAYLSGRFDKMIETYEENDK